MSDKTKHIAYISLFTALVAVATIVIVIPIPGTQGFVNFGDIIILTVALAYGGIPALIAGGIGSALADIIVAYPVWAPFSLVIKGLEGYIAYLVYAKLFGRPLKLIPTAHSKKVYFQGAISLAIGALFMVIGYYFASVVVIGTFSAALASIPSNLLQGFASAVVAYILVFVVKIGKFLK